MVPRLSAYLCLLVCLSLGLIQSISSKAFADPTIRERATEEIAPGIRVRGGGLSIDLDDGQCTPPCAEGAECQEVCRNGSCDARSTASNPCVQCNWECVEDR